MNKNGVVAVVVVIAAVVLVGLWVMRGGQQQRARLACAAAPAAPAGLHYTTQGPLVTLNWSAPGGPDLPTTYVIEAGSEPGAANQGTFVTPGTATSFQREAGPGTYYVRMVARNACGTSPSSPEVAITVQ